MDKAGNFYSGLDEELGWSNGGRRQQGKKEKKEARTKLWPVSKLLRLSSVETP